MQDLDGWPESWREALIANLALVNDRLADYSSAVCSWHNSGEKLGHTFARFALPIMWDYTEVNPLSDSSGNFLGALDWVSRCVAHVLGIGSIGGNDKHTRHECHQSIGRVRRHRNRPPLL